MAGAATINASAEFPRREDPIHVACANHKKLLTPYIQELIAELQLKDSRTVARQIDLLIEGATVMAHTICDISGIHLAKETARQLLTEYASAA